MTDIQSLLDSVKTSLETDKTVKENAFKRGEYFNIFRICGITDDEVLLHSRLMAELLNPQGTHGMGDTFAKSFLKHVTGEDFAFDTSNCNVFTEKTIGRVTEESGGRIDILMQDKRNNCVIIENKIYAGDQNAQLLRYYNYARKHTSSFRLIYLTLDGHKPQSLPSYAANDTRCKTASYKEHIFRWLEECVREADDRPLVREVLKQYLTVIKQLTNQNMDSELKRKLVDTLAKEENLEAFCAICSVRDSLLKHIWEKEFIPQLEECLNNLQGKYEIIKTGEILKPWAGIRFSVKGWENFDIRMEFSSDGCTGFSSAIFFKEGRKNFVGEETESQLRSLSECSRYRAYDSSRLYRKFDKYNDWTKAETLKAVISGEVPRYVIGKLEELHTLTENVDGM